MKEVAVPCTRSIQRLLLAFAAALLVSACAVRSPSIGDLRYNPGRYYNRSVNVEGIVTSSWGIPMVPLKMYRVGDASGDIMVVSDSQCLPGASACAAA
jgi:hypothetical protein